MIILGINAYHADSSAAIFVDGKMIAAIEEERFTRVKHWAGFPEKAIAFCLKEAGVGYADVDHYAIGRDPKAKFFKKLVYLAMHPVGSFAAVKERLQNSRKVSSIENELARVSKLDASTFKNKIRQVEHHRSHIASAFFASPFEKAACLSIDGSGDFTTTMTGVGSGNDIEILDSVDFPHSIGIFYTAFTQLLGFPHYGDEYKVMGMAPYGEAKYMDLLEDVVKLTPDGLFRLNLSYFRTGTQGIISYGDDNAPIVAPLFSRKMVEVFSRESGVGSRESGVGGRELERREGTKLKEDRNTKATKDHEDHEGGAEEVGSSKLVVGSQESGVGSRELGVGALPRQKDEPLTQYHKDLAASVQRFTEKIIFYLLNKLHERTGLDDLCIAGGVAQNSVANGKILSNTPFKRIYIPSAGHDAGISMGAALFTQHGSLNYERQPAIRSAYTGSRFNNDEIRETLWNKQVRFKVLTDDAIFDLVTDCMINGGVVGWFTGRSEFGPRALGGRSIIADPRRADAKEILNLKVKRRESFRPFAPSVLKEYAAEYFECPDNDRDEVPFMEKVYPVKKDKQALIPAVTHVDGTGRLQTVDVEISPRYYNLIEAFRKKTGIPILLNTSFNENEPIVNTPSEALACYLRTEMDMLVMENVVIKRSW